MFTLKYAANRTFSQIHRDPARYIFVMGPVGSGKSSGCILHIWLNALKQPVQYDGVRRSYYGVIRATYPALKSTVIKTWEKWFKTLFTPVYDIPIRAQMRMPHPDGKTTLEINLVSIALDRAEEVNKLQSLELTGVHINEAHEVPREIFQMCKSRYKRYPPKADGGVTDPFIIMDYNAVPTDHWLYKLSEEQRPLKHSFYKQPPALLLVDRGESDLVDAAGNHYKINPDADNIEHLENDYYEDQVLGEDPDWVNVMVLNNYGLKKAGKPVFTDYQDRIHYSEKQIMPLGGVPLIVGMDLGLTPAAAIMQLTPMGQLIVFDELVTEDTSIRTFCEDILKPHLIINYPRHTYSIILDPAASQRSQNDKKAAAEIVKEMGLPYMLAKSNNFTKRREAVAYFLRRLDGFRLGPKCQMLRKGFLSHYCYPKTQAAGLVAKYKELPDKNPYSHIHDGLQYGALEASEGRIARRRRGLHSLTPAPSQTPMDSVAGY